ncbi:hypothetical protein BJ741DRAFT_283554 [Chytriomyces cf. hyalinus JEL632]|nr:hypothetical protein BJ741DRAFT_283554 [Chytriomyces cf. hyalinus JEL632]
MIMISGRQLQVMAVVAILIGSIPLMLMLPGPEAKHHLLPPQQSETLIIATSPAPAPTPTPTPSPEVPLSWVDTQLTLYLPPNNASSFTINQLLDLCNTGKSLAITRRYALGGPPLSKLQRDHYLSNCHPIEIATSQGGRSRGHCSDFVQYIFYADARLSDEYIIPETLEKKAANCPDSFYLHGEYPILKFYKVLVNGTERANLTSTTSKTHVTTAHTAASTGAQVSLTSKASNITRRPLRNIWMPNLEQISKKQTWLIRASHMIACKVHFTCTTITQYLNDPEAQQLLRNSTNEYERRIANNTPILHNMSHSSPDTLVGINDSLTDANPLRFMNSTTHAAHEEDLQRYNRFYHASGSSGRKGTNHVFDCWLNRPELPPLVMIGNNNIKGFANRLTEDGKKPRNIKLYGRLSSSELGKLQRSHGVHLCPSTQEGYGHYINEARSLSSLVVTTNHPPMSEFVEDGVSGVYVGHDGTDIEPYQGLAMYSPSAIVMTWEHVCDAVDKVLKIPLAQRAEMGRRARKLYEKETEEMIRNLETLKKEAEEFHGGPFDGYDFLDTNAHQFKLAVHI